MKIYHNHTITNKMDVFIENVDYGFILTVKFLEDIQFSQYDSISIDDHEERLEEFLTPVHHDDNFSVCIAVTLEQADRGSIKPKELLDNLFVLILFNKDDTFYKEDVINFKFENRDE